MSVAFTKEDSAETASETLLPDRPVSPHPNLVTEAGLKALEFQLHQAREAYEAAQKIEDVNERRRQAAIPLRDMRYFAARVRTAQVIAIPASTDTVAFGSTVTFRRDDGRVQKYRIVGEDEADPKAGSISFVSPVARLLMGKAVGDVVGVSGQEPRDHCDLVTSRAYTASCDERVAPGPYSSWRRLMLHMDQSRGGSFGGGARSARSTATTSGNSAAIPAADSIGMRHRRDHARLIRRHAEVCECSAPAR